MNYNNWNGRRSSRSRGRSRNKWGWRGRNYGRMPMLDPGMHNAHPGYNPNYQMHLENRGFYGYKSFAPPSHRKISPPPKPPSPLPGTEEYTQRNIQHASDLIKRQLNIDSDTCSASDAEINKTSEQYNATTSDNAKDDKVAGDSDKSSKECAATVTSTRNPQEQPKKSTTGSQQPSSKQKVTSKPSESINVQEIYAQIVQHISNLSHSKKINLVNQSTDGYDIAIQQVQKQKRLELSRALRDMSKRQTQDSNDGEVINAIIPDIGIKIEDLPKEVIADLSRTLHIEREDWAEQAATTTNLVDPEACFKQAEAILSVNFENAMDDQGDNFGFQGIDYDYLNKPLSPPEFAYNQLEEDATPSTSFGSPKPVPFPEMNLDEVKTEEEEEEMESDDFTADIDFCIKNLDVHKSYLTCFTPPKQLEARNALFESTDGSFKLPQIKVRTDLLTQSPPVEAESPAIVTNSEQPIISSDVTPQLPTSKLVTVSERQLHSCSASALSKLPDGLEHSTAKIEQKGLKPDTKLASPSSAQISSTQVTIDDKPDSLRPEFLGLMNQNENEKEEETATGKSESIRPEFLSLVHKETVDKSESVRPPEFLSLMSDETADKPETIRPELLSLVDDTTDLIKRLERDPPENKAEELEEINKIGGESFALADEKEASPTLPDLFAGFTSGEKTEELDLDLNPALPQGKPELADSSSELVVEKTELAFPSNDPLSEVPPSNCSVDSVLGGEGPPSSNENGKADASLSAIPESVMHSHAEGTQKRWKSPGEKKMIPNVPSSASSRDNLNVAEQSIDDIMSESDDITKSILEQMEEFNRSLMGMATTEKASSTTNQQSLNKQLDVVLDDKSILETGMVAQVNEAAEEETQNQDVAESGKSVETSDARAKSEDQQENQLKMEVKEESVPPEPTKADEEVDEVKNVDVKVPIESVDFKKEQSDIEGSKPKDVKPEPAEKEADASAKPRHKESSKDRSRSNSKEKQHHRSGSKSKGHHQESHKSSSSSSKNKPKEAQDGGSSHKKIKTPAEKKETMNLKVLKTTSAASTQTDFTEQAAKKGGKREVARNSTVVGSTQTDAKKAKVTSTQTEPDEEQKAMNFASTQTDFLVPPPPQIKKLKTYTLSTQTDFEEGNKKVKTLTLSTQTDFAEAAHSKKTKPKEAKSVQTEYVSEPKKAGKAEKIKSKNSGTQSEVTRTHSKEVQATPTFKSMEIQTDPLKTSLGNEATVDINLNTEGITGGKMMLRKYAVSKLKDIGAQIEHLMKLQRSFYELMLVESDDETETSNAQSTTPVEPLKAEPEDFKPITKESAAPKSRKRKADASNEDNKSSKRLRHHSDKAEGVAAEPPATDEVDAAPLENTNTINKKESRRKRKIEEEKSAAETRGPLNIKISLKNLKASPSYRNGGNEEETSTTAKQKPRKGRDSSKTKDKSAKLKEDDTVIKNQVVVPDIIREEISAKEEAPPDIVVEDPAGDQSEPEEQKQILKIKLPLKRFRDRSSKKANSEAKELVDNVNLMMSTYSKELGKVPRGSERKSKRKSDRRSKQNNVVLEDSSNEVRKHEYDERFFLCNVSLRRYNLQELNQLKETIHSELDVKPEPTIVRRSDPPVDGSADNLANSNDTTSESLEVKSESDPPDKTNLDMSPISFQMLDELKQVVDSVPETSEEFADAPDTDPTDNQDQEIEFNTFNSALLILKVINSTLLAGSETGKLYYYNLENGEVLHAMHLSKKPLTSICVSKCEDKYTVYVGSLNGKISVFDFETKHVANTIKLDEGVQCMELSWDYLFVGTHKGQLVRYDLKKEKVDDSIKIYDTSILAIKATQEGARRVLLLATRNELVSVRDAMTGLFMRTMESSFYPTVYTILLNNSFVYCGTSHHDILVYTFQDGQMALTHEASNSKGVACLKIVGNLLFAGCYNGNVYVYNVTTNDYLGQIVGPGMILSLEVLDDKIFLGTKNNRLKSLRIPKDFLDQL